MEKSDERSRNIAETSDQARQTLVRDRVMVTVGIQSLNPSSQNIVMKAIAQFEKSCTETDPQKEHGFGSIEVDGEKVFFKVDYCDNLSECHSPDVLGRSATKKVLAITLAGEC